MAERTPLIDQDPMAVAEDAINRIKKGAFLTVAKGDQLNTMTIGWALIGHCWRKSIFMVAVRDSRHTFTIIENAADFTVTIPYEDMKKEITFCGTKSGRDVNKFEACHLSVAESREVTSPIISAKGLHFECDIVLKAPMDANFLIDAYEALYPEKDYHTLYFGDIAACYELE